MRPLDTLALGLAAALALTACAEPPAPAQYPGPGPAPGPGAAGDANPGQWSPQSAGQWTPPPGSAQNPGQWTPPPGGAQGPGQSTGPILGPPPVQLPPPGPPVLRDPINDVDLPWLRAAAGAVLNELITALPGPQQSMVQGIPFVTDDTIGEVNAFAACNREHMPLMAMTDGLLQIEAYMAQLRATDEVFGTQKLDAYLKYLAQNQKPKQPIVAPPAGMIDPAQHVEYRKVVREHQLLEEQMAFVLGHELGHHYLGHTGCANGRSGDRNVDWTDVLRKFQHVIPIANQPNEVYADIAGVNNLLNAGARRPGYKWTETGALITLDFFARLDKLNAASLLFAFESSHPNPAVRVPVVQRAASDWRQTGGKGWQPPAIP